MDKKYSITIRKDIGLMEVRFFGKIELDDMFYYLDDLRILQDYDPHYPSIYDFRGCLALGFRIDVVSFVEKLAQLRSDLPKKRIGIIVDTYNQRFLVNFFIVLIKDLSLNVEMFENRNACFEWVMEGSK